jgi:Arc/MetJ family transcription regulator
VFHHLLRGAELPARLWSDAYRVALAIANGWRLVRLPLLGPPPPPHQVPPDVYDRSRLYTSSLGLSMRTNIVIDDALMKQAMQASGARSKREAVELALRTLVNLQQQGEIRAFRGRLAWEGDLETQRLDHESGEPQA